MIGSTDLLHPSPTPHFKTFQVFLCSMCHTSLISMFHVSYFTHFYVPCATLLSFLCFMYHTSFISMFHVSHFTQFYVPCVTLHSFLCSMCHTSLISMFHVSHFTHFFVKFKFNFPFYYYSKYPYCCLSSMCYVADLCDCCCILQFLAASLRQSL